MHVSEVIIKMLRCLYYWLTLKMHFNCLERSLLFALIKSLAMFVFKQVQEIDSQNDGNGRRA